MKKESPCFAAAKQVADDLLGPPSFDEAGEPGFLEDEARLVGAMKKACVAALGFAAQKQGENIKDQQEILSDAADMVMETTPATAACCARSSRRPGTAKRAPGRWRTSHAPRARCDGPRGVWGRNVLAQSAEGYELQTMMAGLRRPTKQLPVNRARLHDAVAERIIEAEGHTVRT